MYSNEIDELIEISSKRNITNQLRLSRAIRMGLQLMYARGDGELTTLELKEFLNCFYFGREDHDRAYYQAYISGVLKVVSDTVPKRVSWSESGLNYRLYKLHRTDESPESIAKLHKKICKKIGIVWKDID